MVFRKILIPSSPYFSSQTTWNGILDSRSGLIPIGRWFIIRLSDEFPGVEPLVATKAVTATYKMMMGNYKCGNAREIYHTFSDFSRSASRWNEKIKSWTILGSTDKTLVTEQFTAEPHLLLRNDIEDGVSRLVDRTTKELWFCGNPSPEERKHLQEKRERQLLKLVRARKQGS